MPVPFDHNMTYDEAVKYLRRAVAEKGEDYVYPFEHTYSEEEADACVYFSGGQPMCIVGHVFSYAGYGAKDVQELQGVHDQSLPISAAASIVLSIAQREQDNGSTWGEALRVALDETVHL